MKLFSVGSKRNNEARLFAVFLMFCILALAFPQDIAYGQVCAPTATATPNSISYETKVLQIASGDMLAYFPLDETSGTVAHDVSGNGRDGTFTGVTLNSTTFPGGSPAGLWEAGDFVNIHTTGLRSAFNPALGTISLWVRVTPTTAYTDGIARRAITLQADTSNRIFYEKMTNNNLSRMQRLPGGSVNYASERSDWYHVAMTWNESATTARLFIDGSQHGSDITTSTWSGALSTSMMVIGAASTSPSNVWFGNIAHVVIWDTELSGSQILDLADPGPNTPTLTPTPGCDTATPTDTPTNTPTDTPTNTNTPDVPTDTPTDTNTPGGPTDTPTDTPTITDTPTVTDTPTETPTDTLTPTPDIWVVWTLPPAVSTTGQAVAMVYQFSAGNWIITGLLFAILVSILCLVWLMLRRNKRQKEGN